MKALTPTEAASAAATPVWIVWWEDPDRSWEAICLSPEECEREYEARRSDALIEHWGKVGKRDSLTLLAWLEGHRQHSSPVEIRELADRVREVLRKVLAGEAGPVVWRAW
jgi:hypothetical protein